MYRQNTGMQGIELVTGLALNKERSMGAATEKTRHKSLKMAENCGAVCTSFHSTMSTVL